MTAVFIDDNLLGFIPKETPIYGNGKIENNDANHAIIKAWLLNKCKQLFDDDKKTLTYLPDKNSEYNGSLILNNKTLFRVTTKYHLNLYDDAFNMLYDASIRM